MLQDRRNVGSDKELAIAETDDHWRALTHRDDCVRLVGVEDGKGEDAAQFVDGVAHSPFKTVSTSQIFFDQMRDDFCVGLGDKLMVGLAQPLFQLQIVFDDAVVNHDDAPGAVAVRVRVSLRWGGREWPSGCDQCRRFRPAD